MEKDPPVRFSPWTPWQQRETIRNAHLPGLYLLAHWEVAPPLRVETLAGEICYIGSATEGSLLGRWQQFHRAAFAGKPGHKGGLRYREQFDDPGDTLYVSAFVPEGLSRELRQIFITFTESRLIWEWARRWDGAPACNRSAT